MNLPQELLDEILELAVCKPGIHFFNLGEAIDPAVIPQSQINTSNTLTHRVLQTPCSRDTHDLVKVEEVKSSGRLNFGNRSRFLRDPKTHLTRTTTPNHTPPPASKRVGWIDLVNPSAYASNGRLQMVSESFKRNVNRLLNIPENSGIKINTNDDIVCLQLPHRPSRRSATPLDLGRRRRFICDTLPQLAPVKKLAIEFEPISWKDENDKKSYRFHPADTGYKWLCFLPLHFPNLETVYVLDYTIRMKGGCSPSPSAERFHGSTHDYIEVLDEDTAWDREIDPLFDGLISYHQRGWTEFFNNRDYQVNHTNLGRFMANDGVNGRVSDYLASWGTFLAALSVRGLARANKRATAMYDVPLESIKLVKFKLLARIDKC